MLNRTNRTLSASIIGLNLGTRSFARIPGLNIGHQALRLRRDPQFDTVRTGTATTEGYPAMPGCPWPVIPVSPRVTAWPTPSYAERAGVEVVAEAPPVLREVVYDDRACDGARPDDSSRLLKRRAAWSAQQRLSFQRPERRQVGWVASGAMARMTPAPAFAPMGASAGG
jgi:hypothetical protein